MQGLLLCGSAAPVTGLTGHQRLPKRLVPGLMPCPGTDNKERSRPPPAGPAVQRAGSRKLQAEEITDGWFSPKRWETPSF